MGAVAKYLSFTGQRGCYAELPLAVLAGATTFTIEAKIATTSTKSSNNNWTWGTIAGREIANHWQDDFGFCVNDGKLCFWAEPKAKNSLTSGTGGVFSNAIVNDGAIHDVAVVSSNGAIDLYCDGLNVAHTDNVNAKISAAQTILLANDSDPNSFLQMDLYEARFWSIARTQEEIFADIEGTEDGLQGWYLPSSDGLQDYSGNNRHATLYGNPVFNANVNLSLDVLRIVRNYPKLLEGLAVWLPFDVDATTDLCANTWTAYGSPTIGTNGAISGKALQLDGSSYLQKSGSISLGGKDFTIRGRAKINAETTRWYPGIFACDGNKLRLIGIQSRTSGLEIGIKGSVYSINTVELTDSFDWEIDYTHSNGVWRLFINGTQIFSRTSSLSRTTYSNVYIGSNGDSNPRFWGGSIDEFQIYDGVALHTENFTPPTAEDYFALKRALNSPTPLSLSLDVARRIKNRVEFSVDVARIITNSRFISVNQSFDVERKIVKTVNFSVDVARTVEKHWLYINLGNADDLITSGTTLTNLPESKSITGTAFYQTTRAKCFDLPETDEIWIKFDVYFDGTNRWRAYNGGSNGTTGITAQTDGEITFFSNNVEAYAATGTAVKNQLQTVLLHMISGSSDGVIEAWLDGTKIYTFTGDVNHGQDFNDIYLQSDGSGTFFSNVMISNVEISLDAGFCSFTLDVERRIRKPVEFTLDVVRNFISPIVVPFIGEHFNHFVRRVKLFNNGAQKIILPKKSPVYIRAKGTGIIKVFSDADPDGKITGSDFFQPVNMFAPLGECETVFVEMSPTVTQQYVIRAFMRSLKENSKLLQDSQSPDSAVDAAINFSSGGLFANREELADSFLRDMDAADGVLDFLERYCGVIYDNEDTGAITGSDADGDTVKTPQSVVPEPIPIENWITPDPGSTVVINGLSVHFPTIGASGSFSDQEKFILAGLNSVWIKQSLDLIEESYGLNFTAEDVSTRDLSVVFIDDENSHATASTSYSYNTALSGYVINSLQLIINMKYFKDIDLTSEDGLLIPSSPYYDAAGYLDRTLAHELTHAVMAVNIKSFALLSIVIDEGLAELVHGIDDLRGFTSSAGGDLTDFLISFDVEVLLKYDYVSYRPYLYVGGYLLFRYLAKQGQRQIVNLPNSIEITELLISDGATDSNYNAATDYTRQIFSADVSRVLERATSLSFDVEILNVIKVNFLLDVQRALLAQLILFPRSSDDFFNDVNNPFVVHQTNSLFAAPRRFNSATPANTEGLQNFEVQIAEQQITDQVRFTAVIPFDIMQQVCGQYLDYHYNMRVERIQQQGILFSCECCSDVDKLLYTQIAYKLPAITTWWKVDGEQIGGTPEPVEIQTIYPSAATHANRIAAALGLSPVIQFDHFLSTVLMDEKGGVTYNDLIRDIFGWSSRVPTLLINIYIRDGKLYFVQRGHESHTVDISNAQMTVPVITKEIVRTSWGSSVESRTNIQEFDATFHTFTPDTIVGGQDTDETVREVSNQFHGNGVQGYTTFTYDRQGRLIQTYTYTYDRNKGGQNTYTTVNHWYNDEGQLIKTETFTQSTDGDEGQSASKSRDEKYYITLPNGEKFLATEYSASWQNNNGISITDSDLVDSRVTVHQPSRVGQKHTTTVSSDGEVVGETGGQNTGDDRVTPYRLKQSAKLIEVFNGSWEETTQHHEHGMTVYGLSLFDSSFPIHDEATLIKVTNELKNLNRKTKETVNVSIYDFEHLIDFNDKIRLNGAEYFLATNTARTTPRIKFEQNLSLVRYY